MGNRRRVSREDYLIGWVCALSIELAASQEMLDEVYDEIDHAVNDSNIYTLGRIGDHNVVLVCLPDGQTGTTSAAAVAVQMKVSFPSIRVALMVGIGGGVPSAQTDIRLGDVVVGRPHKLHSGVVQYDFGKSTPGGFERTGYLNSPPSVLLNAVSHLRACHFRGQGQFSESLAKLATVPQFVRESAGPDLLFEADYTHVAGETCHKCSTTKLVHREPRTQDVMIHYGTIASGNQVMRDGATRNRLSAELGGVLCFEMEAAGLTTAFPCLVIRGVCDYADSHKNKDWQPFAAATAAACAKEVLLALPSTAVERSNTSTEITKKKNGEYCSCREVVGIRLKMGNE
jgi:nucleoside phosphorylase